MFGEYKMAVYIVAAIAAIGIISWGVHTYNESVRAPLRAQIQEEGTKRVMAEAQARALRAEMADLKAYYDAREDRARLAEARRSEVLSRREKRDANGAIAHDDDTLHDLNGLFGNGQRAAFGNHTAAASVPGAAAGDVRRDGGTVHAGAR